MVKADPDLEQCPNSVEEYVGFKSVDAECDIATHPDVVSMFEERCTNRKYCRLTIDELWFPNKCQLYGYSTFAVAQCQEADIEIPGLNPIPRFKITVLAITLDLVVCLAFIVYTNIAKHSIKREARDYESDMLLMSDFAIKVKNLPEPAQYQTLEQLKMMLTLHFNQVIRG